MAFWQGRIQEDVEEGWDDDSAAGRHQGEGGALGVRPLAIVKLAPGALTERWREDLADEPDATELRQMLAVAKDAVSPAERTAQLLHPLTSFVVVPLFALANAGMRVESGALDEAGPVAVGIVVGLVVGKPLGIVAAAWLGVRLGLVTLPPSLTWPVVTGVGAVAGIGFTVSMFVSGLAFDDPEVVAGATLAILGASIVASVVGGLVTWRATRP